MNDVKTYTHQCQCGETYTDNDPDLYFCPACVEQRKKIAEEVDKKLVNVKSSRGGDGFNDLVKKLGMNQGGRIYFKASDLGI